MDRNNIRIRYVTQADHDFWFSLDRHLSEDAFHKRCMTARDMFCQMMKVPAVSCAGFSFGTASLSAACFSSGKTVNERGMAAI